MRVEPPGLRGFKIGGFELWRDRGRTSDSQRALAQPALGRRGHALALHRQGHLGLQPSIVAASVEGATPNMQVTFAPGSFKGGQIGELEETPELSAGAWQMPPLSRGYVEAKSNRPGDMPAINPRYLSEEADRRATCRGIENGPADLRRSGLQRFARKETLPGLQVQSDDELLDYARLNGNTCCHASCACAMSVVDDELKANGIDGLRAIDASVIPVVTSTNTNPTILITERVRR